MAYVVKTMLLFGGTYNS